MATIRKPLQQRSRNRVRLIKNTAREIILEKGSAAFTMLEVAKRSDITVASIYQYFANQTDLIMALASEIYEDSLEQLAPQSQDVIESMSFEQAVDFVGTIFEQYCHINLADPVRMEIFLAVESDKKLQEFNWEMVRRSSDNFFTVFAPHFLESEHGWLRRAAIFYAHGLHNTMRLLRFVDEIEKEQHIASTRYCILSGVILKKHVLSS